MPRQLRLTEQPSCELASVGRLGVLSLRYGLYRRLILNGLQRELASIVTIDVGLSVTLLSFLTDRTDWTDDWGYDWGLAWRSPRRAQIARRVSTV
jgi:hypothetical protein